MVFTPENEPLRSSLESGSRPTIRGGACGGCLGRARVLHQFPVFTPTQTNGIKGLNSARVRSNRTKQGWCERTHHEGGSLWFL